MDAETETLIPTFGGHFSCDPIALAENTIGRQPQNGGNGDGFTVGGPMYTLNATGVHGIAHPMVLMDQGGGVMNVMQDGLVGTLRRETHGHEPIVMHSFAPAEVGPAMGASGPPYSRTGNERVETEALAITVSHPMAFAQNTRDEVRYVNGDGSLFGALAAEPGMKQTSYIQQSMAVRRLTPVECERLQGFPDGYTNIPWRKQPESPDGPRYKALGNSWAVPVARWIGERVNDELARGEA